MYTIAGIENIVFKKKKKKLNFSQQKLLPYNYYYTNVSYRISVFFFFST